LRLTTFAQALEVGVTARLVEHMFVDDLTGR
jgi:hypothetical protein